MEIINTTPHPITFRRESGEEFTVEPCGFVINATIEEQIVAEHGGVTFVRSTYQPSAEAEEFLRNHEHGEYALVAEHGGNELLVSVNAIDSCDPDQFESCLPISAANSLLLGSVIAAQAYPGRVFGPVAAPGYERVPVAKKRMDPTRFVTFEAAAAAKEEN